MSIACESIPIAGHVQAKLNIADGLKHAFCRDKQHESEGLGFSIARPLRWSMPPYAAQPSPAQHGHAQHDHAGNQSDEQKKRERTPLLNHAQLQPSTMIGQGERAAEEDQAERRGWTARLLGYGKKCSQSSRAGTTGNDHLNYRHGWEHLPLNTQNDDESHADRTNLMKRICRSSGRSSRRRKSSSRASVLHPVPACRAAGAVQVMGGAEAARRRQERGERMAKQSTMQINTNCISTVYTVYFCLSGVQREADR